MKDLVQLIAFLTPHGEVQMFREDSIPASAKKHKWDRVPQLDKIVVITKGKKHD